MKYLFYLFLFFISVYFFLILNIFGNHWHYVQPFLISVLLIYFNIDNSWWQYGYAAAAGLFVDSFSAVFGLQAFIFITIIFLLRILQLTFFTTKNILSIIVLTILSFVLFWLLFYLINLIAGWSFYNLSLVNLSEWSAAMGINIFTVIILHLLYFNLWIRRHQSR